jgi:flagellar protein FliS
MYVSRGKFSAASASYKSVDLVSRIEGASPHQLVQVMYEELLKALDAMAVASRRNDFTQRGERQSRALAILTGLETSLDFEKGGEIATGLVAIYREARRLVLAAGRENDAGRIQQARDMLYEIASAWDALAQPKS